MPVTVNYVNLYLVFRGVRVRECLILEGCTIARLQEVRRFLYKQGARMLIRGKNEHLLDASRRRNFHCEVASEWFGSYSLS
jgi:hypothetical protein